MGGDLNSDNALEELNHELKLNSEKFAKFKRTPIIFGQSIQLEHVKSQKFLAFHSDQSNYGIIDNFILHLDDMASELSLFKILPSYKFQNERDKFIRYSQDVYIVSALESLTRDAYLCLSSKLRNPFERISYNQDPKMPDNEEEVEEEAKLTDDFMFAFEKSTKFLINLFSVCPDENNFLQFGDVVWIAHFEKQTCLEYQVRHSKKAKEKGI